MPKGFEMPGVGENEKSKKHPLEEADEGDLIELSEWKKEWEKKRELSEAEKEAREIIIGAEAVRDELVSKDDWKKREEEGARLLEEFDKEKGAASVAAGEIEAKESGAAPEEPKEKVIVEMPEASQDQEISPEAMEANGYFEELRTQLDELEKKEELTPEEEKNLNYLREQIEAFDDLGGEIEEIIEPFELKKLSKDDIRKGMDVLYNAMDKILLDAAKPLSSKDKSALKKWMKKGGEVEDWPLDDEVTAENYRERLAEYGVADFINPRFIEPHKDAYAVVNNQFRKCREELASRKKNKSETEVGVEEGTEPSPQSPEHEEYEMEAGAEGPAVEKSAQRRLEEIREDLKKSEKGWEETSHKLEKKEKGGHKKRKQGKGAEIGTEEDVLGIGEVLREEEKEHDKKIGIRPKPKKIEKKKGLLARLFGKK